MSAIETELKFQVPARSLAAVRRAVTAGRAGVTRLAAVYAEADDDRLAASGLALRLRKEGSAWVQTLKGRADGLLGRPEHEVPLPRQRGEPAIDPARHAGTPVGERLIALLADGTPLRPLYRTEIRRTHRLLRHAGAVVEVALDEGTIRAGDHVLPVREIEFELVAGPPQALLALAARWAQRHGLWLDIRTKAERGHRLARGQGAPAPVRAVSAALDLRATPGAAFAAIVIGVVGQLLPNAAEVADASPDPEHLHQLRVAIRRLRTALRVLGGWAADPAQAAALESRWREPFARLGGSRDDDVLAATLLPALAAAGAPQVVLPASAAVEPAADVVREGVFSALVLETIALALALAPPPADGAAVPSLRDAARRVLARSWKQAMAGADGFAAATAEEQHRARRRLKRLRYTVEFLGPLFAGRAQRRLVDRLRRALDDVGQVTDLLIAEGRFRAALETDARAWFALGWLAAQREHLVADTARRLERLAESSRPWR
jgi:inorganic triphosphatase YgiF